MYKSRISSVAKNFKSLVIEVYKFYIFKKVLTGSIWSIYGSHKLSIILVQFSVKTFEPIEIREF
jgi:hypothetical protein